jgi:hypothetical protein
LTCFETPWILSRRPGLCEGDTTSTMIRSCLPLTVRVMSRLTWRFSAKSSWVAALVEKPSCETVTVYCPGGSPNALYRPSGPVLRVVPDPVPSATITTVALPIGRPCGSVTVPWISEDVWAARPTTMLAQRAGTSMARYYCRA